VFYANAIAVGSPGLRPGFNEKIATHDSEIATMDTDHMGGALNLQWTLSNDMTLTSITGYDTLENFQSADVDGGEVTFNDPGDIGVPGKSLYAVVATGDGLDDLEQITQEFRLAGRAQNLFWQTGFYYFDEDFDLLNQSFHFPPESALVSQQTTSWALFGQAEYEINKAKLAAELFRPYTVNHQRVHRRKKGHPGLIGRYFFQPQMLQILRMKAARLARAGSQARP